MAYYETPYTKETPMNPIQKIADKIAQLIEPPLVDPNTELARQSSIHLGIKRTRAQQESLKKWN